MMTELEDLSAERESITLQIKELRERKGQLTDRIKAIRSGDINLSHEDIVKNRGHRAYVGGGSPERWYGIGKRQYHYLIKEGLRPQDRFLDIACGSLRLGQYLIPYLDKGNYFGLEGSPDLVEMGLQHELLFDLGQLKSPSFSFNYDFDFSFIESFDWAWAQSLFTHLTLEDIEKCFRNLKPVAHANSRFYFTFFEGSEDDNPDAQSHPNKCWRFPFPTLQAAAGRCGWELAYVGDWGHENNQKMVIGKAI